MKSLIYLIIITLFPISCYGQDEKGIEIMQFSKEIKFLNVSEFLYNRINPDSPLSQFLAFSDSLSIEEIEKCLLNSNGKIKTLGLLSLYQTDNQKNFLRIADFLQDSTISFKKSPYGMPGPSNVVERQASERKLLRKAKDLYVADIARSIIRHYSAHSGYENSSDEFSEFLKERKNLDDTAGFLKLLKLKATGWSGPTLRKERQPLFDELRSRINRIENEVDRAIYKIYLSTDAYQLFSPSELVAELKFLGVERSKQILSRHPPTHDPDLLNIQERELHNFAYTRMCKWILLNSKEIFDQKDVLFFLERATYERENEKSWGTSMIFPFWRIAAARVDETNSSEYLKSCIKLFDYKNQESERASLYAELWHRKDLEEIDFILDWIFDSYVLNEESREDIAAFIRNLNQKEDLTLLKRIIADDRFEHSMNVRNVILIAWQVNKLREDNPIADHFTQEIRHPFGVDRAEWWRDRALREHPEQTKKMLERTRILRNELRKIK